MKVFWLLAIFALTVSALPVENEEGRVSGENGWYVPRPDGSSVWMTIEEGEGLLEEMEQQEDMEGRHSTSPVSYYLYTQSNPEKAQKISACAKSISNSNFNAAHPTRFVIHGWTQSHTSSLNGDIRNAWLSRGDFNIIIVDWAAARLPDYANSVVAVPGVGKKVASMVNYLAKHHGMSFYTLQVIGHSLGAHVAGYVGKNAKCQIHTIVGLDPALPLFSYNEPSTRLSSTDGYYVQSIQTNGGQFSFVQPIGKGAFYPNGGKNQPGCPLDPKDPCSHSRSVTYYAEAVTRDDFPTMRCGDYEDAVNKNCGSTYSGVLMGAVTDASMVAGVYYVPVHDEYPYGYGAE